MPEWITPELCPVWWVASVGSFSTITRRARGARSRSARAVARPTMPPPTIAMSWVTEGYYRRAGGVSMARSTCPICRSPHDRLGRRNVGTALAAAPRAIARAVGRASARLLGRRPAAREWSVTEVLAHLLDAEVALGFRIRKVAAEPGSAHAGPAAAPGPAPGIRPDQRRPDARALRRARPEPPRSDPLDAPGPSSLSAAITGAGKRPSASRSC